MGLFWSGETLLENLPDLVQPFAPDRIDCAAYTLAVGREVYVSPTVDRGSAEEQGFGCRSTHLGNVGLEDAAAP